MQQGKDDDVHVNTSQGGWGQEGNTEHTGKRHTSFLLLLSGTTLLEDPQKQCEGTYFLLHLG